MLNDVQTAQIFRDLTRRGLRGSIHAELLDHICLLTEQKMAAGFAFEQAYSWARQAVLDQEVVEALENRWYFTWILNRRSIILVGFFSLALLAGGFLGKMYLFPYFRHRWFIAGSLMTGFFFLPMLTFHLIHKIKPLTILLLAFMAVQMTNLALLAYGMGWNSRRYLAPVALLLVLLGIAHWWQIKRIRMKLFKTK